MLVISCLPPGAQGATITGMQGMGVRTPIAAEVAEATMGLLSDWHMPKGRILTSGAKSMMVAYALFSAIFAFSAICPIKFLQSAFVGAMEKNNIAPEYIEGMLNITSVPMLVVIVAAGLVGGLIGGVIGQKALKKHFIKAGLVSVK